MKIAKMMNSITRPEPVNRYQGIFACFLRSPAFACKSGGISLLVSACRQLLQML
ncbi:hypothetical protein [Chitinophaga ginsengisegetis]|uniref:hypothetical protein n=1 Tax=Chitinophaga ginsengisegetis TaxID=393003 RepID=UPI0034256F84